MSGPKLVVGGIKNCLSLDRFMANEALDAGAASPDVLLASFEDTIGSKDLPPFTKTACVLADVVCHSADIRRPLGLNRVVPESSLIASAEYLRSDVASGTNKRITSLRLSGTDADWSVGDGLRVGGPMAALVLVMAGQPDALDQLAGSGLETRGARIAPSKPTDTP